MGTLRQAQPLIFSGWRSLRSRLRFVPVGVARRPGIGVSGKGTWVLPLPPLMPAVRAPEDGVLPLPFFCWGCEAACHQTCDAGAFLTKQRNICTDRAQSTVFEACCPLFTPNTKYLSIPMTIRTFDAICAKTAVFSPNRCRFAKMPLAAMGFRLGRN